MGPRARVPHTGIRLGASLSSTASPGGKNWACLSGQGRFVDQNAYRVCKTIDIEGGRMLSKHPGKCKFPHGHTRKVEFVLEAEHLDRNKMVRDFLIVKELIGDYLESLDHAICVNTADPAYPDLRALW